MPGMDDQRPGFALPLLLLDAFHALVDELHERLVAVGHPDARPAHGFALQAIGPVGVTTSELGRRLGVTKQAAAKTVAALERLGYVATGPAPADGRAHLVRRTAGGEELLALSAEIFAALRAEWAARLGERRMAQIEDDLDRIGGGRRLSSGGQMPAW
jgi:DNA-binding MarR family transcriptional regulator